MVDLILYAIPFFVILLVVEMLLLRHVHHHPEDEDEALDLAMGIEGPIGYEMQRHAHLASRWASAT